MIDKIYNPSTIRNLYKQPTVRMTTSLVLSVVVSMFFFVFAIRPTILTITNLKKQLQDEQQVLSLITQKVQALQMAEGTYYQAQPFLNYLDQAVPSNPEVGRFNTQLVYLAQKNSVRLDAAQFDSFDLINNQSTAEKSSDESYEIVFNIIVSGGWTQIQSFLSDLEKLERVISIDSINQTLENEEEDNFISTSLKGRIHYYPLY